MSRYILEGCVDSLASALNAFQGGANRLELCANLVIGGTTPSPALLDQVSSQVSIPIRVLIRPRFGDFLYNTEEVHQMEAEIRSLIPFGASGFVIGALTEDGSLDLDTLKRLIDAADGRPITLHRAFDMCRDPFQALEDACALGIDTILTSGQQDSCLTGLPLIRQLNEQARDRIRIMCGAGVSATVIQTILEEAPLSAFHMSGKHVVESHMRYRNPSVHMGLKEISEYELWRANEETFALVKKILEENL